MVRVFGIKYGTYGMKLMNLIQKRYVHINVVDIKNK